MAKILGMSRRDLIRRGVIAGGTVAWTIPVVSTLKDRQKVTSPATSCCECYDPATEKRVPQCPDPKTPQSNADTEDKCQAACKEAGFDGYRFYLVPGHIVFPCVPGQGCTAQTSRLENIGNINGGNINGGNINGGNINGGNTGNILPGPTNLDPPPAGGTLTFRDP